MKKQFAFIIAIFVMIGLFAGCSNEDNPPDEHAGHEQPKQEQKKETDNNDSTETLQEQVTWTEGPLQSNTDQEISIQIKNESGQPIEEFDVSHEKQMHLIIVNKDLSFFNHIHPEYKDDGTFKITTQFPSGGDYKLIADFIPKGGEERTETKWIKINGEIPELQKIEPEQDLTKVIEGKEVTLSFDNLKSGEKVKMTFSIKDAATNKLITNLQPYLGAIGHAVILSEDAEQYIHNHPLKENSMGPDAKFETSFPSSGTYKIWGQFQHKDKVFVVPFVIEVPEK